MSQDHIQERFKKLYDDEADAIFRFTLIRVTDREQALDLTQEAFMRFWKSLKDGQQMDNARAFLFTITNHLIIDWYRKKKSVSLDMMSDPESGEPYEPPHDGASRELELGAEGRFLVGAIQKLPPSYREPVYLRYVEGMSPPEIGKALDISANTASVRITRGIQELRKITGYDIDQ